MKLNEVIATIQPLPYKWISDTRAVFQVGDVQMVIMLEPLPPIMAGNKRMVGINIAFGTPGATEDDLNTELTGIGKPRLVLATVAKAVLEKLQQIGRSFNYVVLISKAGSTQQSRSRIYQSAILDMADDIERLGFEYPYRVNTSIESAMMLSKVELTQQELAMFNKHFSQI